MVISSTLGWLINGPVTHDNEISNNNHNGNIENGDNTSELCNHSNENIQVNVGEVTHTFSLVCPEECDVF